jgi:hypothetical protein
LHVPPRRVPQRENMHYAFSPLGLVAWWAGAMYFH